jgi:hypothetical protein
LSFWSSQSSFSATFIRGSNIEAATRSFNNIGTDMDAIVDADVNADMGADII